MTQLFRVTETIDMLPDQVWEHLVDWDSAATWMGVDGLRPVGAGPVGQGTKLMFQARGADRESEVVVWEPGSRLSLSSKQGGISALYEYELHAKGQQTEIELTAHCSPTGLGWRLIYPLIAYMARRADRGQLRAFKTQVEGGDSS